MPVLALRGLHPRCPGRRAAKWAQVQVRVEQSPSCRLQQTRPPLPFPPLPWLGKARESSSLVWEGRRWGAERGQSADAGGIPAVSAVSVEPELRGWQRGEASAIMKGIPSRWPAAELRGCGVGVILPVHSLIGGKAAWETPDLPQLLPWAVWPELGAGVRGHYETGREVGRGDREKDQRRPASRPPADLSSCPPRRGRRQIMWGAQRGSASPLLQGPGLSSWKLLSSVDHIHPLLSPACLPDAQRELSETCISKNRTNSSPTHEISFPKTKTPVLWLRAFFQKMTHFLT